MATVKISALTAATGGNATDVVPIVQGGTTKKLAIKELFSGSSGGQLSFPATQNASADANTMDDYEEGTWTPAVAGSSTAGAQTYATQAGRYTKIGRVVFYEFYIIMSALDGTTAGDIRITGLPFSAVAGNEFYASGLGRYDRLNLTTAGNQVGARVNAGATHMTLFESTDNNAAAALQATALSATTYLFGSGFYFT